MAFETILFDLDETLIVEQASDRASFDAACRLVHQRHGIDPERIHQAIIDASEKIWLTCPYCDYCTSLGIASWEGLWGRFTGDYPNFPALRDWVEPFKLQSWTDALSSCGVDDSDFAAEISTAFQQHRQTNHTPLPGMYELLDELQDHYTLALITNGVPDIQRCKITAVDLEKYFKTITISGELGIGKPDSRIFTHTLEKLSAPADRAIMIGNSLGRDIQGAHNAQIRSVWLMTDDPEPATTITPDHQINNLKEIPSLL